MKPGLASRRMPRLIPERNWLARALEFYWPLLLPVLLLASGLNSFPYRSYTTPYSDLTISHYPNAVFLLRALRTWHTIPLWSPAIYSGYPFFADPLSGLWYPPGWIALIFPLPLGFNLAIALHLLWGGAGMYRFMRSEGASHAPALYAALAFECLPKIFAHFGAGHLTLIYAFAWTPWLLAAVHEHWPGDNSSRFLPGLILALIFLADPRWAFYAGLLWIGFAIFYEQIFSIRYYSKQIGIAALLGAPLALPLFEYTRISTRLHLAARDVFAFSLPFNQLLGMVFPPIGGYHEWVFYPGGAVLVLAPVSLSNSGLQKRKKFWLAILALSLFFSLGSQVPFLNMLAKLPGFSLLRVPPRALFLAGLAFIVLAASALDGLLNHEWTMSRRLVLGLTALNGFAVTLAVSAWVILGIFLPSFVWGALSILLSSLWVALHRRSWISPGVWLLGLLVISLVDWGVVDLQQFHFQAQDLVYAEGQEVADYLAGEPGTFRVYSPSYSVPQQTAARLGLELADGIDPLQMDSYARFMAEAGGYPLEGYSVSLPPFEDGNPAQAQASSIPNPKSLGLLNIRYVAAEFDLNFDGLTLLKRFGDTRIYKNLYARPRAWVQPTGTTLGENIKDAWLESWSPNRIVLSASGPGKLVLSEITYPGWHATIDGSPVTVVTTGGLLRSVILGPGEHRIVFTFRPTSLYLGLVLSILGLVFILSWNKPHFAA